jgi:hypothetical protein
LFGCSSRPLKLRSHAEIRVSFLPRETRRPRSELPCTSGAIAQENQMSTTPNSQQNLMAANPTNGMAIAGFVCSLLGLLTGGHLLSPVGLILSAVALGRPGNRALAGWGVALGILGLCGWAIALIVAGTVILGLLAALLGIGLIALANPVKAEITADMAIMAAAIEEERDETGYLPADLATLGLDAAFLTDHWGNAYEYRLTDQNERGYELISAGEDRQIGTGDDITFSKLDELWGEDGLVRVTTSDDEDGEHVRVRIGGRTIDVNRNEDGATVDVGDEEYEVNEGAHDETEVESD